MPVKIDTREKFTVLTPEAENLSANLTEGLLQSTADVLQSKVKNVILNLQKIQTIDKNTGQQLINMQQEFYKSNASFVICELQAAVARQLKQMELYEIINITFTESEAWDIVQMEEIERELMSDDDTELG